MFLWVPLPCVLSWTSSNSLWTLIISRSLETRPYGPGQASYLACLEEGLKETPAGISPSSPKPLVVVLGAVGCPSTWEPQGCPGAAELFSPSWAGLGEAARVSLSSILLQEQTPHPSTGQSSSRAVSCRQNCDELKIITALNRGKGCTLSVLCYTGCKDCM